MSIKVLNSAQSWAENKKLEGQEKILLKHDIGAKSNTGSGVIIKTFYERIF